MSGLRLDRPLVLEAMERAGDGAGGWVETWVPRGTLWAHVRPGAGREAAGMGAAASVQALRIVVRGLPQGHALRPVAGQRFRDGARVFRVLAVTESDGTGRHLLCSAEEVTG